MTASSPAPSPSKALDLLSKRLPVRLVQAPLRIFLLTESPAESTALEILRVGQPEERPVRGQFLDGIGMCPGGLHEELGGSQFLPQKVSEDSREGERNLGDTEVIPGSPASRQLAYACSQRDFERLSAPTRPIDGRKPSSPSLEWLARAKFSRALSWRTSLRIELRVGEALGAMEAGLSRMAGRVGTSPAGTSPSDLPP